MHNILEEIIEKKKQDIDEQKKKVSLEEMKKFVEAGLAPALSEGSNSKVESHSYQGQPQEIAPTNFKENILSAKDVAIIAEIKLASPTIPSLGFQSEIIERAIAYENTGANAISFITEQQYFKGNTEFISKLKKAVSIPIVQKDFVIDEYQIYEAKSIGSDALLLIVRYLDKKTVQEFVHLCFQIGVEPIVEINNEEDLEKAVQTNTHFISVNARNLENFAIDVERACAIMQMIPDTFIKLGFSGIHSSYEVNKYKKSGAKGVLVGTELMRAKNVKEFLSSLRMF